MSGPRGDRRYSSVAADELRTAGGLLGDLGLLHDGQEPAKHNIFGFVDRVPNPFELFISTARNMRAETLWELLGRNGKRVIVINVPVTYPPGEVNGILVGCFLGTDVRRLGYPPWINRKLEKMGYHIDVDAQAGRRNLVAFIPLFSTKVANSWQLTVINRKLIAKG